MYGRQNESGLYRSFNNTIARARLGIALSNGSVLTNECNGGFRTSFQDNITDSGIWRTFSASSILSITRKPNSFPGNSHTSTYQQRDILTLFQNLLVNLSQAALLPYQKQHHFVSTMSWIHLYLSASVVKEQVKNLNTHTHTHTMNHITDITGFIIITLSLLQMFN